VKSLPRLYAVLAFALLCAAAIGLGCGPQMGFGDLSIVVDIRLPHLALAAIVGAGLATTGAALQAMSANPLADPFVIGASSGASVGVVAARWLGIGADSPLHLFFAALGSFLAIMLVLRIARIGRRFPVQTLLLSGITVSTLGSAIVLLYFNLRPHEATSAMLFLMGSLEESRWSFIALTGAVTAAGVVAGLLGSRALNAFAMGESTARHLGVDVERTKLTICVVASAMIGPIVAASGLIGFVGLIVPHIVRRMIGSDHRRLLPACTLGGATFLIVADAVARTAAAPERLALGAITALCGGPFFLYLLLRRRGPRADAAATEPRS
jgi:iron complex transport system permease protein